MAGLMLLSIEPKYALIPATHSGEKPSGPWRMNLQLPPSPIFIEGLRLCRHRVLHYSLLALVLLIMDILPAYPASRERLWMSGQHSPALGLPPFSNTVLRGDLEWRFVSYLMSSPERLASRFISTSVHYSLPYIKPTSGGYFLDVLLATV